MLIIKWRFILYRNILLRYLLHIFILPFTWIKSVSIHFYCMIIHNSTYLWKYLNYSYMCGKQKFTKIVLYNLPRHVCYGVNINFLVFSRAYLVQYMKPGAHTKYLTAPLFTVNVFFLHQVFDILFCWILSQWPHPGGEGVLTVNVFFCLWGSGPVTTSFGIGSAFLPLMSISSTKSLTSCSVGFCPSNLIPGGGGMRSYRLFKLPLPSHSSSVGFWPSDLIQEGEDAFLPSMSISSTRSFLICWIPSQWSYPGGWGWGGQAALTVNIYFLHQIFDILLGRILS